MDKIVNVAKDFSRYPAGREKGDGDWNGGEIGDSILIKHLLS